MLVNETACYYCNGSELLPGIDNIKDHLHTSDHTWRFLLCKNCDSLLLTPRPDDASLAGHYPLEFSPVASQNILTNMIRSSIRPGYWLMYRWLHRVQALITLQLLKRKTGNGLRLLDVGCGNGVFLQSAAELGFEVTGCEQRESAITYIKDTLKLDAICADTDSITQHFPPNSFDVISLFHVIEHLSHPSATLKNCFDLLKPGGLLILGLPMIDSLQASLLGKRWCCLEAAPRHLSVPTKKGLKIFVENGGFEDISIRSDGVMLNSIGYAHSIIPKCMHAHTPAVKTLSSVLIYTFYRIAGMLCTYCCIPLAALEKFTGRSGMCIISARKPLKQNA